MNEAMLGDELEGTTGADPEDRTADTESAGFGDGIDGEGLDESAHGSAEETADDDPEADVTPESSGAEAAPGDDPDGSADADALAEAESAAESAAEEAEAERRGPGPGADLSDEEIARQLSALLFASPEPLSVGKLVGLLDRPPAARVRLALEAVALELEAGPLPLQLRAIRGGYTIMTVPDMGQVVGRLAKGPAVERISPAALETLAIVAYRQPVTKAEIEAIRGVQAGPILRSLVDRTLVKVTGRADVPGHPLQYGTTKDFLDRFGLMSLDDLPRDAELAKD